jgi:4-hydroxythreonine-4-phosphate dehydrogenase
MKKKVAISIGDLNGIGIQLALQNHRAITHEVEPLYCIDALMLQQAAEKLHLSIPSDFTTLETIAPHFTIEPGKVSGASGNYAYASFVKAVALAKAQKVDAICTLPIHKKAWELAGIKYKGHTDALRDFFKREAIMMLGWEQMYVALYSEHVPLKEVAASITVEDLTRFLIDFYHTANPTSTVAVLGLNPHAGDDGVLGDEERIIQQSIENATKTLHQEHRTHARLFTNPLVPDVAFSPNVRRDYTHYIAMYHDQGLSPLKALYFDESINVSLNLPILRTSVDHGTAFDIAYQGRALKSLSYKHAIKYITQQETKR